MRQFLTRRFLRLAVPFWIALGLLLCLIAARFAYAGRVVPSSSLAAFLSHALLVSDVVGWVPQGGLIFYWSFVTLFQFYALWLGAFWLVRRASLAASRVDYHERTMRVMTLLAWAVTVGSGLLLVSSRPGGPHAEWQLPYAAVYIGTGMLVYRVADRSAPVSLLSGLLVGLVALGIDTELSRPIWAAVTAAILLCLPRTSRGSGGPGTNWVAAIGRRSFSIYLVHGIVMYALGIAGPHLGCPPDWGATAGFVVAAGSLSIAVGFLFYRAVERPTARAAGRVQYRF